MFKKFIYAIGMIVSVWSGKEGVAMEPHLQDLSERLQNLPIELKAQIAGQFADKTRNGYPVFEFKTKVFDNFKEACSSGSLYPAFHLSVNIIDLQNMYKILENSNLAKNVKNLHIFCWADGVERLAHIPFASLERLSELSLQGLSVESLGSFHTFLSQNPGLMKKVTSIIYYAFPEDSTDIPLFPCHIKLMRRTIGGE